MKVLFIGDIVGRPGRRIVNRRLPDLRKKHGIDFVIADAENSADGYGLTPSIVDELAQSGVDLVSVGDHLWDRREIVPALDTDHRLVRPFNYPPGAPGRGSAMLSRGGLKLGFLCAQGRVFMQKEALDDPFREAKREIEALRRETPAVLVEIHAEATSEKEAFAHFLDGLAGAVVGTHTHVQTADERILPGGTGFMADVGMTGPAEGVIGFEKEGIIARFTSQVPGRAKPATGLVRLSAVVVELDEKTGQAQSMLRISETAEPEE